MLKAALEFNEIKTSCPDSICDIVFVSKRVNILLYLDDTCHLQKHFFVGKLPFWWLVLTRQEKHPPLKEC